MLENMKSNHIILLSAKQIRNGEFFLLGVEFRYLEFHMDIPSLIKVNVQNLYVQTLKLCSPLRRGSEFKYI